MQFFEFPSPFSERYPSQAALDPSDEFDRSSRSKFTLSTTAEDAMFIVSPRFKDLFSASFLSRLPDHR